MPRRAPSLPADGRYREAALRTHERYAAELRRLSAGLPGREIQPIAPQLYHCLPWLFADLFPALREEDLTSVAVAGLLYFAHVLILDRALDGDRATEGGDLLVGSMLHERALTLLFPHFSSETPAWEQLHRYMVEYARAVAMEHRLWRQQPPHFTVEAFECIGAGKAALLKASPAMLACMDRRPDVIPALDRVLDPCNVAMQMQDDLEDWAADFRARRHSWVLARGMERAMADSDDGTANEAAVGHALFYSTIATDALEYAMARCRESARRAREIGARRWEELAVQYAERAEHLAQRIAAQRRRGLAVAAGTAQDRRRDVECALLAGARALETQGADGYRESRHEMTFPRAFGFGGESEHHTGIVFQRAIVGWAYRELAAAGVAVEPSCVAENLDALRRLRLPGQDGGWSYFPTLPELPPDSDDLAQVLLAFGTRAEDDDALFAAPVSLVLRRHHHDDGAVDTWLIDPALPAETRRRYQDAIDRHWGRAVDAEVVANFWYALLTRDASAQEANARAAAAYVGRQQGADGSWQSTWYVGPYYGTFVCSRLLARVSPDDDALARAREFLLGAQRPDGGWAVSADAASDALSTALASLALLHCPGPGRGAHAGDDVDRALATATRYLLLVQHENGLWPAADFIRMDANRAVAGAAPHWLRYGSATVTSAYAALALSGMRRAMGDGA